MTQVLVPDWLGPFYGSELTFQDCEVLTIQHIGRSDLAEEASLMASKWWDYRRLHPLQATYYFMECYKRAYQDFIRIAVDADRAPFVKPVKGDDFLQSRERLSFWRLRQRADSLGIRYPFFLNRSIKWYTEECFRRSSLYAPRPGQIGSNEELLATIMLDWEDEQVNRMQYADDPWFKTENYVGSVNQQAYEAFIIESIRNRQVKRYTLSDAIYTHDALRVEEAIRQFGGLLVSEAIDVTIPIAA